MRTHATLWMVLASLACSSPGGESPAEGDGGAASDDPRREVDVYGFVRELVPPLFPNLPNEPLEDVEICLIESPSAACTRSDVEGRYHLGGLLGGERALVTLRKEGCAPALLSFTPPEVDLVAGDNWAPYLFYLPSIPPHPVQTPRPGTGGVTLAAVATGLRSMIPALTVALEPPAGDGPYFFDQRMQAAEGATSFDGAIAFAGFANVPPGEYEIVWNVANPETDRCEVLFAGAWDGATPYGLPATRENAVGVVVRDGLVSNQQVISCTRAPQPITAVRMQPVVTEGYCGDAGTATRAACVARTPLQVAYVTALGTLDQGSTILGRDGGYSVPFRDSVVWIFGDTFTTGGHAQSSSVARSARDYLGEWAPTLEQPTGTDGQPVRVLSLTADEEAHNGRFSYAGCAEPDCAWWTVWPSAMIADPERDRILVTYAKLRQYGFGFGFEATGYSLAAWEDLSAPAPRVAFDLFPGEPTLLTTEPHVNFGTAGLIEDGFLYLFQCGKEPVYEYDVAKPCYLARAPAARALEPTAWTYLGHPGDWTSNRGDAQVLFDGALIMSVAPNDYLGGYLATYVLPMSNTVVMRFGQTLEGPWSDPVYVFEEAPPAAYWIYDALAHPELEGEGGRLQYVTYSYGTAPLRSEMRFVEVALARP